MPGEALSLRLWQLKRVDDQLESVHRRQVRQPPTGIEVVSVLTVVLGIADQLVLFAGTEVSHLFDSIDAVKFMANVLKGNGML